ncbi:MAG TPA: sulfite exporter TauE/SafE family protein [Pseudomonadales bacterium]|nr:sulfite exporter TauE/SafE family protein [Pseudomonadales bacterium]
MPLPDPFMLMACAAIGAVAGFLAGLLGIGGGVVIVPALLILFDAVGIDAGAARLAVGTSLATIIVTSLSAARAQIRRGAVQWPIVRSWTPALLVGSFASGPLAALLPPGALPWFIGCFLLLVAAIMLTQWRPDPHRTLPRGAANLALGGTAGLVSGLAGIGGGNVIVPTLVFHNVPIQQASATSSTLGVPIALFGALGFVIAGWGEASLPAGSIGYVYLPAALTIAAVTFLVAPLGVAVAHHSDAGLLKRVFGALLLLVSGRILYGAWAATTALA